MNEDEGVLQRVLQADALRQERILESFAQAYKQKAADSPAPGQPGWVEVYGLFAGNLAQRMVVHDDGSDVVQCVRERQADLIRRYGHNGDYVFVFNGFVAP